MVDKKQSSDKIETMGTKCTSSLKYTLKIPTGQNYFVALPYGVAHIMVLARKIQAIITNLKRTNRETSGAKEGPVSFTYSHNRALKALSTVQCSCNAICTDIPGTSRTLDITASWIMHVKSIVESQQLDVTMRSRSTAQI